MAGMMTRTALWDVAPCSLEDSRPHDGGSTRLYNVGLVPRDYKALHPRNRSPSGKMLHLPLASRASPSRYRLPTVSFRVLGHI
jgi:hypothetical protein